MDNLQLIWSWQPALYLFLGGMGASAFVVAAVLYLRNRAENRLVVCVSAWVAVASLGVGLLLLLTELITPLRGLMMWQSFSNFTSLMAIGAWLIFCAVVVFGVFALLMTVEVRKAASLSTAAVSAGKPDASGVPATSGATGGQDVPQASPSAEAPQASQSKAGLGSVLAVAGIVLGAAVAIYTGILLMCAPGVPLWNTPLLPLLFTVSALDTGVAAVELIAVALAKRDPMRPERLRAIDRVVVGLIIAEGVVLALLLVSMLAGNPLWGSDSASFALTAADSASLLASGALAPLFWVALVIVGLALPLVVAFRGALSHIGPRAMALGGAAVLVGGCSLRFLVLLAGMHVDYVADVFMSVLI